MTTATDTTTSTPTPAADEPTLQVPTTRTRDYMGRLLVNPVPGTTVDVRDYLGRAIQAGDRDYLGIALVA